MSLRQIKLAPQTICDIYRGVLYLAEDTEIEPAATSAPAIKLLGANKQSITILVNEAEVPYLSEKPFNFLAGILSACKLSMADVALLNVQNLSEKHYQVIETTTRPQSVILFGVTCAEIGLPLQFPHFQVHKYNNINYLSAPALPDIEPDKMIKTQLWGCLKSLFHL